MANSYDIRVSELTSEDPRHEHPSNTKVRLKQHQLTLLHRCIQYENEKVSLDQFPQLVQNHRIERDDYMQTKIGILGDHVGSGKSYVILSLILANPPANPGPSIMSYACNQVLLCMHDRLQQIKTSLLVVPHNLSCQWEKYVESFSDNIRFLVVNKMRSVFPLINEDIPSYDLIIVTSTFYNKVASILDSKKYKLRRVFFDEVDDVNIPNCAKIEADFYWFVTASYGSLIWPRGYSRWDPTTMRYITHTSGIRNSGFVKTMFMDLACSMERDLTKVLVIRNSPQYVHESMRLPDMETRYVKCKTPITINILSGLVNRHVMSALNAGDLSTALQYVNPSNRTTEDHIIQALINKYTMHIRNLDIQLAAAESMEYSSDLQRTTEITRIRTRKQDLERKIESIRERIRTSNTCTICFDEMNNKTVVPCCSNSFCFECISRWLTSNRIGSCPMCKFTPLGLPMLMVVSAEEAAGSSVAIERPVPGVADVSDDKDKLQNLEAILLSRRAAGNAKFLICSSFDNSLSNIIPILDRVGIRYSMLRGNHMTINKTVQNYKTGSVDALLINAQQYGSGLNLENTTDLIMFHKFDTVMEKQVVGRAQRYGREQPLKTWYLLYDNEIHAAETRTVDE
jgi:SNF2 family DNA or RNA helicase